MINDQTKILLSKLLSFLPDKTFCTLTYLLKQKRLPNLKQPEYFNDKLLYLKLNQRDPILKKIVDKYEVRKYISSKIGDEYLIPLIGLYTDPDEVDFNSLPPKFALKPTVGSQQNLICKDKSKLDWEESTKMIRNWMNYDPYERTREWPYKDLAARFVIEEFIEDRKEQTTDYKFWCFNGVPRVLQLDLDRFGTHKRKFYYAQNFKEIVDIRITHERYLHEIDPPYNYDEMLDIASELSKDFPFVRVDLYNIDGKIYFGEMTFYPGNCNEKISPVKYEKILGDMLNIEEYIC